MNCPGGCVNGGGQPHVGDSIRNWSDVRALRAKALYDYDKKVTPIRRSSDSPVMKKLYSEYFEKPGSHKAHEVLHTKYVKRSKY